MKPVKINIENLYKSFGEKTILNGINLSVYTGEILCILGKSGTGKSVILKHLIGILKPDKGAITVDNCLFTQSSENEQEDILKQYGILFQGAALFDSMNVFENVAFGLRRTGVPNTEIKETVHEMLEEVGLRGVDEKMPSEISGGMQKRVGLARAVAMKPEIMLYDEPTTGVDPITAGAVDRLIQKMRKLHNITSVVVTHDIQSACRIADRIAVLMDGEIIFTGTPEELIQSTHPFIAKFTQGRIDVPE